MSRLPPVSPHALHVADIIVTGSHTFDSWVVRRFTHSSVSHAMAYIGAGEIVESEDPWGVRKRLLDAALADCSLALVYRDARMAPGRAHSIRQFLVEQAGRRRHYDKTGAFGCVIPAFHENPGSYFCSELVFEAYRNAGIPIYHDSERPPGDMVHAGRHHYHLRCLGCLRGA